MNESVLHACFKYAPYIGGVKEIYVVMVAWPWLHVKYINGNVWEYCCTPPHSFFCVQDILLKV